ncbi:MAG: outer membrane lipoprotein-sorting protein [Firmicutes bacterium]|nr:outer membrane lipoprotein-sorting protein [Bacillota bacterium]
MLKQKKSLIILGILALVGAALNAGFYAAAVDLTGEEILVKVDGILDSPATIMDATMTTINAKGEEKSSQMRVYTKKNPNGKTFTLIEYLAPAADKGSKFLSLGDVNQMWMYLPKVEKSVRIAGSMVKQSMMNSDFSYEDLMNRSNFNDYYSAQVLGNEAVDGESCYVLDLKAKKGSAHYRQLKLWVRQENFIPAKEEFYSGSGKLVKVSTQSEIKTMSGRLVPTRITFQDLAQKGHQTILTIKNVKFNADLPDSYFDKSYLEKGQ